jgi:hypothetical protein
MATQRRIDPAIEAMIHDLAGFGYAPAQIERTIRARFGADRTPLLRTVQRIVREDVPADSGRSWSFIPPAAADEDRFVLEVLADVVEWSDGRRTTLSEAEAAAIVGIRRVAPELPPRLTYRLARYYMGRSQAQQATSDLDLWLAFEPWRDDASRARYEVVVDQGAPRAPIDQSLSELKVSTAEALKAALLERFRETHPEVPVTGSLPRPRTDSPAQPAQTDPAVVEMALEKMRPEIDAVLDAVALDAQRLSE